MEEGQTLYNGQKDKVQTDKPWSIKHHTENQRSSNTNPTKNWGEPRCCTKNSAFTVKLILTTSTK